jgi:RNA polymerase sigma-70 factor (ECF subfamily)
LPEGRGRSDRRLGKIRRVLPQNSDNILHNREDAEECVNETWLKAWNAIPPTRPTMLKTFLGKICRNLALDHYEAAHAQKRGKGVVEIALDELADISIPEQADDGEITRVINEFLHSEPKEHADIFVKRYWYLCSVKQIAAEYGYGENKVTSLLFRMRGRLKQKLESEGLM